MCGGGGGGVWRWGKREIIYLSPLGCHHQNDFCIKMGSSDSHFNVLVIVRNKVTRQCAQTMMNRLNYLGMLISIQAYCSH